MHLINHLDAHQRISFSLCIFVLAFLVTNNRVDLPSQLLISWDAFALVELILAWVVIAHAHPAEVRRAVRLQDSGRRIILLLIVASSCISLVAVAVELASGNRLMGIPTGVGFSLGILAVLLSWIMVHTMFTLHYAHMYYSGHAISKSAPTGGLAFPGEQNPDYLDFAYFSFTIGMTWQVSDVAISSGRFRRVALLHSVLSFGFNTIILAIAVSIVSSRLL
jgi:uncharacterized membrane protein